MEHNVEYYASVLNYLLYKRKDEQGRILNNERQPALQILPLIDFEVLANVTTFGSVAFVKILHLIGRFYKEYHTTPSKVVYNDLLLNDPLFSEWFTQKATTEQRLEVSHIENFLFEPVDNEIFFQKRLKDLAVQLKVQKMIEAAKLGIKQKKGEAALVMETLYTELHEYRELCQMMDAPVKGNHRYLYRDRKRAEDYQEIAGVKTQFDLIELRPNGLFALFGGPKDGKTRVAIAVARYLAATGYDVAYGDLENGDKEVEARFLQAELTKWKGYPVAMRYFYSGTFIHEDRIPEEMIQWTEEDAQDMKQGEICYVIEEWTDIVEDPKTKEEKEKLFIELSLFEAKVHGPTEDPLSEELTEWEPLGPYEEDMEAERVVQPFQEVLDEWQDDVQEDMPGEVRIDYIPAADISEIKGLAKRLVENPRDNFFSKPWKRVLIVDWMQLLQNKKFQSIWERTRDSYSALKIMQARYQMYIMVVDAVKDREQLRKLYPNFDKAGTVGTTQTDFNVASSVLFCVSEEEKESRTSRLVAKATRYGSSGKNVQEQLVIDKEYATIKKTDLDYHMQVNPELYSEKPDKRGNKGGKEEDKNMFDDVQLDD